MRMEKLECRNYRYSIKTLCVIWFVPVGIENSISRHFDTNVNDNDVKAQNGQVKNYLEALLTENRIIVHRPNPEF